MLSKFIENPWRIFNVIAAKGLLNWMPDKAYLKLRYRASLGKKLDLNNPRTFNEKMQWLKLYDHRPEYAKMVDKYEVKKYVADIIGEEYIIPTLGIWDSFDEIDFEGLPSQFVLKCTHDSGDASGIMDYKVHNFNGIPKIVLVCSERFSDSGLKEDFFDDKWRHLDLCRPSHSNSDYNIEKPESFDKMLELSRILANKIPFVRTDFYEVEGKLYFGELTFYPASEMEGFCPDDWDNILGSWLTI